jgi:long-chain acyl-CoA synthetase
MARVDIPADATLPRLLDRNAETRGGAPAMREKSLGVWRTLTWSAYRDVVRDFALGLASLGFTRGDVLAVIGDNRPGLYAAQLAVQCLGGIPTPLYQDAPAEELVYVLEHAEASVIIAEDQEQVDKVLSLRARLPKLRLIVYEDSRGMFHYRDEALKPFAEIARLGQAFGASHPRYVEDEIAKGRPEDIALLCYTSGTTGRPKGAMLSHTNLIASSAAFLGKTDLRADDDWLAYLPMAWIGDALYTLVLQMMVGFACNCPESPETVQRDLRELGPSAFLAAPRIWENLLTQIQVRAADASWLKRKTFEYFRDRAIEAELLRTDGKPVPAGLRLLTALGEFLVYGPVRDQIGLRRARWCLTGGAPLGADTFRFFRAFGVNLKQVYGSTELSAFVSVQPDTEANPNTVGPPAPEIEVRIAGNGEVLVRGANVFRGYFKQDEATRQAIDAEGWFHTGDAGFIDPQGHLAIIDRAKDVGKLADGTPFAPQFVENKLKFSPYIGEAISFGHERDRVTAMIAIALAPVGNWAERQGLAYSGYQDLTQKPEVRSLIRAEIEKCNQGLLAATRVRRFLLLAKDFDADDEEITRTRKLRRNVISQKYASVIDALYGGASETEIATEVTYEDGQRATVRARVAIEDVHA